MQRSGLYISSSCDRCDAHSWLGIKHEVTSTVYYLNFIHFFPVMNGFSIVTAQKNQLFAPISALFMGHSYTEKLHRQESLFQAQLPRSWPPRSMNSCANPRAILLISAVCLWGKTGGLHGAHFKIIATNANSSPLTDIKARGELNPSICLRSITIKEGGFVFKGHNAQVILERVSLFVSLWLPTWVEQRTTTPQYCCTI